MHFVGLVYFSPSKYSQKKNLNKLILLTTINEPIIIFILETIFDKIQNEPNSINAFLARCQPIYFDKKYLNRLGIINAVRN